LNYWRLAKEYTENDIKNLTNAQINDLLINVKLALTDKAIKKDKAIFLLLNIALELNHRV
jgi:hypothetical protein